MLAIKMQLLTTYCVGVIADVTFQNKTYYNHHWKRQRDINTTLL